MCPGRRKWNCGLFLELWKSYLSENQLHFTVSKAPCGCFVYILLHGFQQFQMFFIICHEAAIDSLPRIYILLHPYSSVSLPSASICHLGQVGSSGEKPKGDTTFSLSPPGC